MTDEILAILTRYLSSQVLKGIDNKINPEEALISSGLIDSFNLVDLAIFIEETFGIEIEASELCAKTFDTLNELVKLIKIRQEKTNND